MRTVIAKEKVIIPLGRQGENEAVEVRFQVSEYAELYGAGAFELLNQRPGENTPYTCTITAQDGYVSWVIQAADVALVGHGKCELTYVVDQRIAKSTVYGTCVLKSVEGSGTVPEPYESRIQELIERSADITVDADRAEAAQEAAETAQGKAEDAQEAAETAQGKAEDAQEAAEGAAENAEAWAVGKRGGVDVPPADETYHNNAEFYAYVAQQGAETSGYVYFDVNDEDGCLYVTTAGHIGEDVTFEVDEESGILEVIYS